MNSCALIYAICFAAGMLVGVCGTFVVFHRIIAAERASSAQRFQRMRHRRDKWRATARARRTQFLMRESEWSKYEQYAAPRLILLAQQTPVHNEYKRQWEHAWETSRKLARDFDTAESDRDRIELMRAYFGALSHL